MAEYSSKAKSELALDLKKVTTQSKFVYASIGSRIQRLNST